MSILEFLDRYEVLTFSKLPYPDVIVKDLGFKNSQVINCALLDGFLSTNAVTLMRPANLINKLGKLFFVALFRGLS